MTDQNNKKQFVLRSLVALLKPITRLALRYQIQPNEIIDTLKLALVGVAKEELVRSKHKITASRVSLMSGLNRRDVTKFLTQELPSPSQENTLISKVINLWQSDKRFLNSENNPKLLGSVDDFQEFYDLVRLVNRELNPATVLFELERASVIEKTSRGIKLLKSSYSPSDKAEEVLSILASDMDDLVRSVDENINNQNKIPNLHARTSFDKVRADCPDLLRSWLVKEGHELHRRTREHLSTLDQDVNPDPNYKGKLIKVSVGTFSHIDQILDTIGEDKA